MPVQCRICANQAENDANEKKSFNERQRRLNDIFHDTLIGLKYLDSTFENYHAEIPEQSQVRDAIKLRVRSICHNVIPARPWALLLGGVGTGKTHLFAAAIRELTMAGKLAVYQSGYDLFQRIKKKSYGNTSRTPGDVVAGICARADVFLIDDFGVRLEPGKVGDGDREIIFVLFDYLDKQKKPLFLASNYNHDEFKKVIDADGKRRIADRIRGNVEVFGMNWNSHRGRETEPKQMEIL